MDFNKIYKDYWEQLYSTAVSYLKNREDALDVTQDAFLSAYESLDNYDDSYSLSTWLTQICINKCRDKLRQRKRLNKVLYSENSSEVQALLASRQEDNTTPEQLLEAEEGGMSLEAVFLQLPANILQAVSLKLLEDKSYKEISETMGVPVNTAKTWVRRGRQQLLQAYSPQ